MDNQVNSLSFKLLLVDDEKNILSALTRLFRNQGYEIFTAQNGIEGLKILEKEPVDLIISDMRMPEMDGSEFLEKAAKKWPDTIRILLTGYADLQSTIDAINKGNIYQYISKPWEDNELRVMISHALHQQQLEKERKRLVELTNKQNEELLALNESLEQKVRERTAELSETMRQLEQSHDTLKKNFTATIKVFSSLIELREGMISGHSRIVSDLAYKLANGLGLPHEDSQNILLAGLLHDIGKLALPDKILNVPPETLRIDERREFIKHPVIAQALLMSLDNLQGAATLIRNHQERFDGKGFPDHLEGNDIPLGSRILSVVSDYDALQKGMIINKKMNPVEACDYLKQFKGIKYDPELVDVFLQKILNEYGEKPVKSRRVDAIQLRPGMTLANDLVTNEGLLLLSSGFVLNLKIIQKIQNYVNTVQEDMDIYIRI